MASADKSMNPNKRKIEKDGTEEDEPCPKKLLEEEVVREVTLLDVDNFVLLKIFKYLRAHDLKALAFTCTRFAVLVLDRSLWHEVDTGAIQYGCRRFDWLVRNCVQDGTRKLRVTGYANEMAGCNGLSVKTRAEEIEQAKRKEKSKNQNTTGGGQAVMIDRQMGRGAQRIAFAIADTEYSTETGSFCVPDWPREVESRNGDRYHENMDGGTCIGPKFTLTKSALLQLKERSNLTELKLEYCNIDHFTNSLAHFPPNLKILSLRGTRCFNNDVKSFMFKIQDYLVHLEDLDLSLCSWFEPSSFLPLSKVAKLKRLLLTDCSRLGECVAYASLATRYGFRELQILDARRSPLGDSEVSAFGWLPNLEELYLEPRPANRPGPPATHAHHPDDPFAIHDDLEEWERSEIVNEFISMVAQQSMANRGNNMCLNSFGEGTSVEDTTNCEVNVDVQNTYQEIENESKICTDIAKTDKHDSNKIDEKENKDQIEKKENIAKIDEIENSTKTYEKDNSNKIDEQENKNQTCKKENIAYTDEMESNTTAEKGSSCEKYEKENNNKIDRKGNCSKTDEHEICVKTDEQKIIGRTEKQDSKTNSLLDSHSQDKSESETLPLKKRKLEDYINDGASTSKDINLSRCKKDRKADEQKSGTANYVPNVEGESLRQENKPQGQKYVTFKRRFPLFDRPVDDSESDDDDVNVNVHRPQRVFDQQPHHDQHINEEELRNEGDLHNVGEENEQDRNEQRQPNANERRLNIDVNIIGHVPENVELDERQDGVRRINPIVLELGINEGGMVNARAINIPLDRNERVVNMQVFNRNPRRGMVIGRFNVDEIFRQLGPMRNHIDDDSLVTDTAIHRFGKADNGDVNFINIGPIGLCRQHSNARPNKSKLKILVCSGYGGITNKSLDHLVSAAPDLKHLDVRKTGVTNVGVENFKNLRPDCQILFE